MIDQRLRTLRVVEHYGNVTRAAAALNVTPSTVSHQLRQLSRDLGVALLRPEGRGVRLTPAARVVVAHANVLCEDWERAEADLAQHVEGESMELRLCGVSSAVAGLLAPTASLLRTTPRAAVHVRQASCAESFALLLTDDADIAVVLATADNPPYDDVRFEQQVLLDDPVDLMVPRSHSLAGRPAVELAEAAHEPWIQDPARADQYDLLRTACAAAGFTPRIAHHATEWFAISALVAEGFGVCLMPRLVPVPPEYAIARVPLRGAGTPYRRMLVAFSRGRQHQPGIAAGLDALRAVATKPPGAKPPDVMNQIYGHQSPGQS